MLKTAAVLALSVLIFATGCDVAGPVVYETYETYLITDPVTQESILCCSFPYPPDMVATVEPRCAVTGWRCDPAVSR